MIDEDRWWRFLCNLHDAYTTDDPNLTRAERDTVLTFGAVHWRITHEEER